MILLAIVQKQEISEETIAKSVTIRDEATVVVLAETVGPQGQRRLDRAFPLGRPTFLRMLGGRFDSGAGVSGGLGICSEWFNGHANAPIEVCEDPSPRLQK